MHQQNMQKILISTSDETILTSWTICNKESAHSTCIVFKPKSCILSADAVFVHPLTLQYPPSLSYHYLCSLPSGAHPLPSFIIGKKEWESLKFLDNGCKQPRRLQKTRMKLHLAIEDTITMLCALEVKFICLIFPYSL